MKEALVFLQAQVTGEEMRIVEFRGGRARTVHERAVLSFVPTAVSSAVGAILTIAQAVPTIDKRLGRVSDVESQIGPLPPLVQNLYREDTALLQEGSVRSHRCRHGYGVGLYCAVVSSHTGCSAHSAATAWFSWSPGWW